MANCFITINPIGGMPSGNADFMLPPPAGGVQGLMSLRARLRTAAGAVKDTSNPAVAGAQWNLTIPNADIDPNTQYTLMVANSFVAAEMLAFASTTFTTAPMIGSRTAASAKAAKPAAAAAAVKAKAPAGKPKTKRTPKPSDKK